MTRPEHLEQGLAHRRHSVNTCGMVPRRPQDKSPVQQLAPCLSHLAHSRPSIPFTFPTFPQSQPPLPQRTPPGPPHPVCLCTSMPWLERFHLPRHPSSPPPQGLLSIPCCIFQHPFLIRTSWHASARVISLSSSPLSLVRKLPTEHLPCARHEGPTWEVITTIGQMKKPEAQ